MVQGGGMDSDMNQKSGRDSIENEADNGLKNEIGTLAMARTGAESVAPSNPASDAPTRVEMMFAMG